MSNIELITLQNPNHDDLEPLEVGLSDFNFAALGPVARDISRVAVIAKDEAGHVIGGAHGMLIWEWLHIETLWLGPAYRRQKLGTHVLQAIEQAAMERGYTHFQLETTSFQALEFYQKNGYEIFGELPDKPRGSTWYYLKKVVTTSRVDI